MQARSLFVDTVVATAAITEFAPVTYDGQPAGTTDVVKGVAQTDAAIGDAVAVTVLGTSQVRASEAVAAGDLLVPDGAGGVKKAEEGASGFARANRDAAAGTRVEAMLLPM